MKKTICAILTAVTVFIFAEEPSMVPAPLSDLTSIPTPPLQEMVVPKQGFFYVRFATAESDLAHVSPILPGLGIGYRRLAGNGAADISFSGIGRAEGKKGRIFWTAPKASYIHYLQPNGERSAYVGGGLAWGGIKEKDHSFIGIIPSATVGYEFAHKSAILGFAELNVSQPAAPVYRKGFFPGPMAEISVGVGF